MDKATSWALSQLDKIPPVPVPVLVGLAILLILIYPTIRKALKAHVEAPMIAPQESAPVVQLNAGAVYTVLTNIQIAVDRLSLDLQQLTVKVEIVDRMLRRRKPPAKR